MRLHRLLVPAVILALAARAAAASLPAELPPHPRLLFTDQQLAQAIAEEKTDPLRAKLHEEIVAQAEKDLTSRRIEYKLVGPRLLDQSRLALKLILTEAYAYRLTKDDRYLARAVKDLDTVCAFQDWHKAHFLDVAELSFAVSIGYDWLYPSLTPEERQRYEQAILDKALCFAEPAYAHGKPKDHDLFFVTATMNWNQVCNTGLLTAALAVADDHRDLAELVIDGARRSLPLAMAAYAPDGGFPEGPGYWEYGTIYNVIGLTELQDILGTDFGLSQTEAFDKTALYRMAAVGPTGKAFNYADGEASISNSAALAWFGLRFRNAAVQAYTRQVLEETLQSKARHGEDERFFALHGVWFPPAPEGAVPTLPLSLHFRGRADIALLRTSWTDRDALFVGFKAGDNSANHSHLDLGSFVLDAEGVRWAEDMGPDDYNLPRYFGEDRWKYLRLTNLGHNTLTPGTELQLPKAVAPIVAFGDRPQGGFAVANLSPAYPDAADSIERGIEIVDSSRVIVQDEIVRPRAALPYRWQMITRAATLVEPKGRMATLTVGAKDLTVTIIEPEGVKWSVKPAKPTTKEENQNAGYWLLSFDVLPPANSNSARIVVAIDTVKEGPREAPKLPVVDPLTAWH